MAQIFISYSRQDTHDVQKLADKITAAGHSVWIDREGIRGGEQWRQQIVKAIDNSHVFLLMLSPNSINSDNVRKELDLAEEEKAPIIPVIIKAVTVPDSMKYQLAGLQRVDLATNPDTGFNALLSALERFNLPAPVPPNAVKQRKVSSENKRSENLPAKMLPSKNVNFIAGWLKRIQEEGGDNNFVIFLADKQKNIYVQVVGWRNQKSLTVEASKKLTPPLRLSQAQIAALKSLGYEDGYNYERVLLAAADDNQRLLIAQEIMKTFVEVYGINPDASIDVEYQLD